MKLDEKMCKTENPLEHRSRDNELVIDQGSGIDDPVDPDFPVDKLSLEDVDFEAGFWFAKFFPALCIMAWALAIVPVLQFGFGVTENAMSLLMLGGTTLVGALSVLVAKVWVYLFPCPDFFLRVSLLWTRLFRSINWINHARLSDMRMRRNQLIDQKETPLNPDNQ